ncbi:hypothetical protein DEJ39_02140 [Bacteroidetes bacterium SCGC AAA795-G10]|nr:hypothetical protein DEJ39_02140 [Bacteroidetes bacterium SCGC AAA795-G10]
MTKAYLDDLNLFSVLKILFRHPSVEKFIILNDLSWRGKIILSILDLIGICMISPTFFYGSIRNNHGESLYMSSRREASLEAFKYSEILMKGLNLNYCGENQLNGINVVKLFIAKRAWDEMEYYIKIFNYIKNKEDVSKNFIVVLRSSNTIKEEFLKSKYSQFEIYFRKNISFKRLNVWTKKIIKFFLGLKIKNKVNLKKHQPTTVLVASHAISLDKNDNPFPNWFKKSLFKNFHIINTSRQKLKTTKKKLFENGITLEENFYNIYSSLNCSRFTLSDSQNIPYVLKHQLNDFFKLACGLKNYLMRIKCDLFLFIDAQDPITDAVQLISKMINVETRCIQHTNMGIRVPLMITSADTFFSFSEKFKNLFHWKNIGPKNFYSLGYIFKNESKIEFQSIKKKLKENGVEKIIVYFDESVQKDKWGCFSQKEILDEIELLAKTVINNENIAILLKPQFVFNTVKNYNSQTINQAFSTQRFFEISRGEYRNDITPWSISKYADYCIGNLIGATAALECALRNKKVILINSKGYIHGHNSIYKKAEVIFPSLEIGLNKIIEGDKKIGDWSSIINELVVENSNIDLSKIDGNLK